MSAYRIELVTRLGNYTCPYTATGPDMFEALVRLRRQLEPDGLMVAVQGSRRDTYPSGMARDMGGGMQVYIMRPGLPGRREDLVRTLDDASPGLAPSRHDGSTRCGAPEWLFCARRRRGAVCSRDTPNGQRVIPYGEGDRRSAPHGPSSATWASPRAALRGPECSVCVVSVIMNRA